MWLVARAQGADLVRGSPACVTLAVWAGQTVELLSEN